MEIEIAAAIDKAESAFDGLRVEEEQSSSSSMATAMGKERARLRRADGSGLRSHS
jgi:hypothetical protein